MPFYGWAGLILRIIQPDNGNPSTDNQQAIMITVHQIEAPADLQAAFAIREKVFVEEQRVPRQEEYDEYEAVARHYLATADGTPCGAARWRKTDKGVKLERFAVLPQFRSQQVGSQLLKRILADVQAAYPQETIYLHAQVPAMTFYARQGFEPVGETFQECDIDHYKMIRRA
jgi:predicted GNAT family N-acyltransferase